MCCLLSCLSIISPTLCLSDIEQYREDITDKNGNIIGGYFVGEATEQDENYIYPKFLIHIENLNTLEEVGIKEYYYVEETGEKGTETYMIYSAINNEYFEIYKMQDVPYAIYYTLIIDNIEYELDRPVWGYKSPTKRNLESININLKVVGYDGDKIKVEEEEKTGILATLGKILEIIINIPVMIVNALMDMLGEVIRILFVPTDGAMDALKDIANEHIIDRIPALNLPIKLLQKVDEVFNVEWIGLQGLQWNEYKLMNTVIIPEGQIDFRDLHEGGIGTLHNITIIFTSGILSIYFVGYLKKKIDKIF